MVAVQGMIMWDLILLKNITCSYGLEEKLHFDAL